MNLSVLLISIGLFFTIIRYVDGEPIKLSKSYWTDATFLKSFAASYGVNPRIEPYVSPDERVVLLQVAKMMAKGDKKLAINTFSKSAIAKKSAAILFNKGNIYTELEDVENAIKAYNAAIEIYPSFRGAHKNLGLTHLRAEQYELAKESLVKAVSLGDMAGSTLGMLGYCHLQDRNYSSALQAYRLAQVTEPDTIDWKAGIAQCLVETDQINQAFHLMREVVKSKPEEVSYQLLMVSILLQKQENTEAISILEWLGRQNKLSPDSIALLAQLHARNGTIRLALPWFEKLKESLNSETYPRYLQAIEVILDLNDFELANDLLLVKPKELKLDSELLDKRDRLMSAVLLGLKKPGAKKILEALITRNPLDGLAMVLLAKVFILEDEINAAEIVLNRAEKIENSKYQALFEHGTILVAQKKYMRAIEKFEMAQQMRPSKQQEEYIRALKKLIRE